MSEQLADKGFFGYEPSLEEEVFELQREGYPGRDPDQIARHWRWMFVQSARRLGLDPTVWLYRKRGAVVAHQGAIPVRLRIAGEQANTGWFVETLAADGVRGSPIGPMLIKKALEDMPLNLSLGQTEQMRQLQYAMGWKQVCTLTKYVFVTGYRMSLRNKLPAGAAEVAALAIGARHNWLRWGWTRRYAATFRAEPVRRFTSEHDDLWTRMAETCECAVVRDASYLNWKYVDRPWRTFECIGIRHGDELAGVVVMSVSEASDVYPYRRGYLVDFVAPLDSDDVLAALIVQGVNRLKQLGVQTVTCQVANAALCNALERVGFTARQSHYQFLVAPGSCGDATAERLTDAGAWFLTLGDSDADSYPD